MLWLLAQGSILSGIRGFLSGLFGLFLRLFMGASMSLGLPRLLLIWGVPARMGMVMIRLRLLGVLGGSLRFGISLISTTGMRFIGRSSFALGRLVTTVGFRRAQPGRLSFGGGFARV